MNENKILRKFGVLPGDRVSVSKKREDGKIISKVFAIVKEIHPDLRWVRVFYPDYGYSECFLRGKTTEYEIEKI